MVRTGAVAYFKYDYETTFGGDDATKTKTLGFDVRLTGFRSSNTLIALPALNDVNVAKFVYGSNKFSMGIDFAMSNPWWLEAVMGTRVTAGVSPFTHTYTKSKTPKPIAFELGQGVETANEVRTGVGVVFNSATISSSIDNLVRVRGELLHGKELAIGTTLDSSPPSDDLDFPYTFVHGTFELPNGTVIAELQSEEITIGQNAVLLWEGGGANAVAAYRRLFEITGRFSASKKDKTQIQRVIDRVEVATCKLKFTNGLSGVNEKTIDFQGTGVGVSEHNVNIEPNEPIFDELVWQIRSLQVVATNNVATPP